MDTIRLSTLARSLAAGFVLSSLVVGSAGAAAPATHPGCEHATPRACVELALAAMGGKQKLAAIDTEQLDIIADRSVAEQSYQQAPFLTTYARTQRWVDFRHGVTASDTHSVWPESDLGIKDAENDSTVVASATAAVARSPKGDRPAGRAAIDAAREVLALGPERLLLNAAAAPDLHYLPDAMVRATAHTVVAFQHDGTEVRVLLNRFNHLPDAVDSTRTFDDFWAAWGDVTQREYFGNWKVVQGVVFPTSRIVERNGIPWASAQILDVKFNVAVDPKKFAMDPAAVAQGAKSVGWNVPFQVTQRTTLAPGIDFFQGPWSMTFVHQKDGVLVLEAPIGAYFVKGALAAEAKLYPKLPVKGVLTTSDSWPHLAGVREAVARGLPVYALDLNLPILKRMVAAPHTLQPDDLQKHPQPAHWVEVAGKLEIGSGVNRVVLYPLRGVATGRQYMVYFPDHELLYASDTLVLKPDGQLYDPELMREVAQAVQRNRLAVKTVYAMHQAPVPWQKVQALVNAAVEATPAR